MRPDNCDRARRWVSLALDDDLSELEGRLLDTHLERCGECRTFDRRIRAVAHELRGAELVALQRPLALPHRRGRLSAFRVASVSAAAAAAAVAFGVFALSASNERVRPAFLVQTANVLDTEALFLREARRSEMIAPRPTPAFAHVKVSRGDI
jgi:putative zinc finger protein